YATPPRVLATRPPPSSTPFPYTTLFRSWRSRAGRTARHWRQDRQGPGAAKGEGGHGAWAGMCWPQRRKSIGGHCRAAAGRLASRSEEHTSELQSRENLVCRLLLEKKKKK